MIYNKITAEEARANMVAFKESEKNIELIY